MIRKHSNHRKSGKLMSQEDRKAGEYYNDLMNSYDQVGVEESIAAYIFDCFLESEEECAEAGRNILKIVLKEFRPDLFESPHSPEGM